MRQRVLYLLKDVLRPELETVGDMSIIIGGTKTQRLHHDVPREESNNHDEYIKAMHSEVAPCSILIGMGKEAKVLLGIQDDQINVDLSDKIGFIKDGNGMPLKVEGGMKMLLSWTLHLVACFVVICNMLVCAMLVMMK